MVEIEINKLIKEMDAYQKGLLEGKHKAIEKYDRLFVIIIARLDEINNKLNDKNNE